MTRKDCCQFLEYFMLQKNTQDLKPSFQNTVKNKPLSSKLTLCRVQYEVTSFAEADAQKQH